MLRDHNLIVFEQCNDFDPADLLQLACLSLSHNRLINLYGVAKCIGLLEINVNFN